MFDGVTSTSRRWPTRAPTDYKRVVSHNAGFLPTWWIEVSFENVCAHGQIHKEGCKPRLRPSSLREGPLHSPLNFTLHTPPESTRPHTSSRSFSTLPPRFALSPLLATVAMCMRVSCQGSDPRTNILALFEERELLGAPLGLFPWHIRIHRSIDPAAVRDPANRHKYRRGLLSSFRSRSRVMTRASRSRADRSVL